jgi:tRNA(His) 5'-end guanylyltransferase
MKNDDLGDRMKEYESLSSTKLLPYVPAYVRIDGRSFSRFTNGCHKPFDQNLWEIMNEITRFLVHATHAKLGYHQSDEISLVFFQDDYKQELFFDGKIQKLCSVIASMTSSKMQQILFNHSDDFFKRKSDSIPHFDCRVCSLPNKTEAANMILWRCLDAHRNAIQGLGQANFSHKELQGKSCAKIVEMLRDRLKIDVDSYDKNFLYGTFVKRHEREIRNHTIDFPMNKITNRIDFLFDPLADPIYEALVSNEGL